MRQNHFYDDTAPYQSLAAIHRFFGGAAPAGQFWSCMFIAHGPFAERETLS